MNLERTPFGSLALALTALLFISAAGRVSCAEEPKNEEPQVDAEVYYSEKTPKWAETKKLIDDLGKKYKGIKLKLMNVDAPENRDTLSDIEKERNLTHGDLTFIFGPFSLVSKGDKRDVELYMEPLISRILNPKVAKGRLPASVPDYVKEIFGKTAIGEVLGKPDKDEKMVYYKVVNGGKQVGWAIDAYHVIKCPICNDVQFLMAVDMDFKTLDIRPVRLLERKGRKLEDAEAAKFMAQFKKQLSLKDDFKITDALSGATKTTTAYEDAMNDIISELKKETKK